MTLVKEIRVYCRKCGYEDLAPDSSTDYDKLLNMEDEDCPQCLSMGADAL